jgi:kynureninase
MNLKRPQDAPDLRRAAAPGRCRSAGIV